MKCVKLCIMDVDGTLTNGAIYIGQNGEIMKAFSVKDGVGVMKLHQYGIIPAIITGRSSEIVQKRARELKISALFQGVEDKPGCMKALASQYSIRISEIAYIGDDENDLPCMEIIKSDGGIVGCPADAVEGVASIANYVCRRNGGDGAVREFIEWLLLQDEKISHNTGRHIQD